MRKIITLFLITLFVLGMAGSALAKPANITEALFQANQDIKDKYYGIDYFFSQNVDGRTINEANWAKNSLFSYGTPKEASPGNNDFDPVTKHYRYHGYTMNGEKYTNTFFRNDTTEIVNVNSAIWILKPWKDTTVQNFVTNVMHEPKLKENNPFNNDPALLESINQGFENLKPYNPYIQFERTGKQWQEYVHVLQPPTKYTFGMGRLFRLVGGQMRYLTIPLPPLIQIEKNLVAVSIETGIPEGETPTVGQRYTGTVTFRNDSEEALTAPVGVWHNGYALNLTDPAGSAFLSPGSIAFGAKGTPEATKSFTFDYGPVVGSSLLGAVNHAPTAVDIPGETNQEDNVVEATIPVSGYDIKIALSGQTHYQCISDTIAVGQKLKITRKDNIPGNIKATVKGTGGPYPFSSTIELASGASKEQEYSFPAAPGTYSIQAETWPVGLEDIYPVDNKAQVKIVVTRSELPDYDKNVRSNLGGR